MKKIINIHIFFFFFAFSAFGQIITIQCDNSNSSNACFLTDPAPFESSYFANIQTDGTHNTSNGWSRSNPSWVKIDDDNAELTQTGTTAKVKWSNTPNNPIRKIQVIVIYSKSGQADFQVLVSKDVIVKHIGEIPSLTVQNGSPASVNVSGSTVQLPCGNAPFTITTTPPVTSPSQTILYQGRLPAGWTGTSSSSSSNVVTITPNSNDGRVTILAKRSDGTIEKEFHIDFSRSAAAQIGTPTITSISGSNELMCSNDFGVFQGAATGATNFTWTTTGSITKYNYTPTVVEIQPNGIDRGVLTLTVSNGCGIEKSVSKTIFTGAPTFSTATVDGESQQYPNYIQNPAYLSVNSDELTAAFSYQIAAYNGSITPIPSSPGGRSVYAYAYPFVQIQANTTNRCGSNSTMFFLYNVTTFYRMASPNPTQNIISVEMEKELGQQALVSVKLISHGRNSIERSFTAEDARRTNHFNSSNKIDFNVANLPRGTYYLMIDFKEGKKFKETIILN